MTTYALVHGAWHSGWHWGRLASELASLGHRTVAPDLPIEESSAGGEAYAAAVLAALDEIGETSADVVVVGHSMGGLTVPLVAAARSVRRMVFLGAMFPTVGLSADDSVGTALTPEFRDQMRDLQVYPDGSTGWPIQSARKVFFAGLTLEDGAEAAKRLRRQHYLVWDEVCPLRKWPKVPSAYILCRDDAAVDPNWSRQVSRDALGVEAIEIDGDHDGFLSQPGALAKVLDELSAN